MRLFNFFTLHAHNLFLENMHIIFKTQYKLFYSSFDNVFRQMLTNVLKTLDKKFKLEILSKFMYLTY